MMLVVYSGGIFWWYILEMLPIGRPAEDWGCGRKTDDLGSWARDGPVDVAVGKTGAAGSSDFWKLFNLPPC